MADVKRQLERSEADLDKLIAECERLADALAWLGGPTHVQAEQYLRAFPALVRAYEASHRYDYCGSCGAIESQSSYLLPADHEKGCPGLTAEQALAALTEIE